MSTTSLRSLRKRPVVDTATAETIGTVQGVMVDVRAHRVARVVLRGRDRRSIAFEDVIAIGPDALTVRSADVVGQVDGEHPGDGDAYGSRLLLETGYEVGEVTDLGIDEDGTVVSVTAGDTTYDHPLLGIGRWAVVIGANPS